MSQVQIPDCGHLFEVQHEQAGQMTACRNDRHHLTLNFAKTGPSTQDSPYRWFICQEMHGSRALFRPDCPKSYRDLSLVQS